MYMSAMRGREVLRLYRAILRRGDTLTHTDKDFFRKTVGREFRKWSRETNSEEIAAHIEVG